MTDQPASQLAHELRSHGISRYVQGTFVPQNHLDLEPIKRTIGGLCDCEVLTFEAHGLQKFTGLGVKKWGFYATAKAINGSLKDDGYRTALVVNRNGDVYVWCVDVTKTDEFKDYCLNEPRGGPHKILCWLDSITTTQARAMWETLPADGVTSASVSLSSPIPLVGDASGGSVASDDWAAPAP